MAIDASVSKAFLPRFEADFALKPADNLDTMVTRSAPLPSVSHDVLAGHSRVFQPRIPLSPA
jgi:hypothetical protein